MDMFHLHASKALETKANNRSIGLLPAHFQCTSLPFHNESLNSHLEKCAKTNCLGYFYSDRSEAHRYRPRSLHVRRIAPTSLRNVSHQNNEIPGNFFPLWRAWAIELSRLRKQLLVRNWTRFSVDFCLDEI